MSVISGTRRADWFIVPTSIAENLRGLPGAKPYGDPFTGDFHVHRSMLPLVDHPDAEALCTPVDSFPEDWALRDTYTRELGFKLRTTQHQAIDFMQRRRGALLCDDMRMGKTASAVMTHEPSMGQLVIIAPLSTRAVWLGWLKRVFPETPIGVISGKTFDPSVFDNPIVFGHYDVIHKWQGIYPIGTLVFDEAHLIGNMKTRSAKAAAAFRVRAERVLAMTGTPIWNLPWNLWSILGLITPGAFGGYHDFCNRYGAPVATGYGPKYTGLSHESELRARMSEVMLRRRWVDCVEDLPPITRSVVVAELSQAERNKLDIIAAKLKNDRTSTIGNFATYRKQITLSKLATTVAEAEKIIASGEPVVIWTWHVEYAEQIAKKIDRALVIHGEIHPTERDHRMQLWRDSPTPTALVSTMPVAQVGIDLSHARHAIFAEIDYTPAIIGQAEMRTFSPDRPMAITFIIADHLVDKRITKALIHKLGASDPLGVAAATDAIDSLREAVMGPVDDGSLDRLLEDLLASQA